MLQPDEDKCTNKPGAAVRLPLRSASQSPHRTWRQWPVLDHQVPRGCVLLFSHSSSSCLLSHRLAVQMFAAGFDIQGVRWFQVDHHDGRGNNDGVFPFSIPFSLSLFPAFCFSLSLAPFLFPPLCLPLPFLPLFFTPCTFHSFSLSLFSCCRSTSQKDSAILEGVTTNGTVYSGFIMRHWKTSRGSRSAFSPLPLLLLLASSLISLTLFSCLQSTA